MCPPICVKTAPPHLENPGSATDKAFPTIFSGQTRPSNSERIRPVHLSDLFKAELHNVDPHVALNISNIFYKAEKLQTDHIKNRVTLALHHLIGAKHKNVTAENLLNKNE